MLPELTTYSVVRLRISILCGVGEIVRLSVSFAENQSNLILKLTLSLKINFNYCKHKTFIELDMKTHAEKSCTVQFSHLYLKFDFPAKL